MPMLQDQGKYELLINLDKCLMSNHSMQDCLSLFISGRDTHFYTYFEKYTVGQRWETLALVKSFPFALCYIS